MVTTSPNELPSTVNPVQFGEAYCQGYRSTSRLLAAHGASYHTAEEVSQAAWARGWECRGQLQDPSRLCVWVNSIALNLLRTRHGQERRYEELGAEAGVARDPAAAIEVRELLSRLGRRDAALLCGFYRDGFSAKEIAAKLGISPLGVRLRLLRMRHFLRELGGYPRKNSKHTRARRGLPVTAA